MFRGTTPTIYFKVKNIKDLSNISELWITIQSKTNELQKTLEDVIFDVDKGAIVLELSQEDTLQLTGNHVNIQLRFLFDTGKAYVSRILTMPLEQVLLKEGVITPSEKENQEEEVLDSV